MAWIAEQLLAAIFQAASEECITEARLVELTDLETKQVENAAQRLLKHCLIERVGPGCHKLTDAGRKMLASGGTLRSGPNGSQPGKRIHADTLRMRVWHAMRIRRKASTPEIIGLVAKGGDREKGIESNVGKYLRALERTGYLKKLPRREPGVALTSNGFARYLLLKDTGPLAPVWRTGKNTVYDPNTEEETPLCG